MPKENSIDKSYRRGKILIALLKQARSRAEASPLDERLVELGITTRGDKKQDAINKINNIFDELLELGAYVALLDMAKSLERASRDKIGNHIGRIRKTIDEKKNKELLPVYKEKLLIDKDKFRGLGGIEVLVQGYLGEESATKLTAIRDARNNFAHGEDVSSIPSVDQDSVRDVLKEVLDLL